MQEIISIGNKVDMEVLVNGEVVQDPERHRILSCRVVDFPNVNQVRVTMPFFEGRIVPLSVGEQFKLHIFSEKGIHAGHFTVINRTKEGNLFLADLEIRGALKKVQRREYFRYECRMPASYRMVQTDEYLGMLQEEPEVIEWKKCVILDISGGGLRVISEWQEEKEQMIQVQFVLSIDDENYKFTQYGKLISSERRAGNVQLFEQRIEFEQMGEKDREQIIRYIFNEERKKISKEKGLS